MRNRTPYRACLLLGVALLPFAAAPVFAQTSADPAAPVGTQEPQPSAAAGTAAGPASDAPAIDEVIITGQTTRGRALITSSADITIATRADVDRRAPKSLSDLLELVPGIFVEGTAGEVSNNYSVRGLRGGSQRFVQLQEDGLPILYGGGGADEFFFQDITIDRLEAVKGGSSGVLTVNGAGATINFINRKPNYSEAEGIARFTGFNYGLKRGDFYYSMPITGNTAFNFGGFIQSNPGVRDNPFDYGSFQVKGAIEHRFDGGGYVRASARVQDTKSAYYADQPYSYTNGQPGSIPGLDSQFGSINGNSFGRIATPVSTFVNSSGFQEFKSTEAIRAKVWEIRLDAEKPIREGIEVFAHARYINLKWNFNGLFPGSNTGNGGLASAVTYLTPGSASPISGLLAQGQGAFPTSTVFGIKDLTTGIITPGTNVAALNGLNGNGFLQQTTLNHDQQRGDDFGSNFGARWEYKGNNYSNSLTGGGMYFNAVRRQNQSATTTVLNDVRSNSHLYDVVALDGANNVVGTLTDNGILSYGNWGQGQTRGKDESISAYVNDELVIGKLHLDAGIRYEWDSADRNEGQEPSAVDPANRIVAVVDPNSPNRDAAGNIIRDANGNIAGYKINGYQQLLQPGTAGITGQQFTFTNPALGLQPVRTVGATFGGTFNSIHRLKQAYAWTVGANYQLVDNFAFYARYADGFQTNGVFPVTGVELYEAGIRFRGHGLNASVTYFHTNFASDFYNFQNATNFAIVQTFQADLSTDGVEIDATYKPARFFELNFQGVFQEPTLNNLRLNGVAQTTGFNGNTPERTPKTLFTISPRFILPNGLGEIYGRYKYIGQIFADAGNGLALPAYGVTSLGFNINVSKRLTLGFDAENIFNEIGLTEGNPRQGQTQTVTAGYFYARGIVGPTYGGTLTFRY